MVFLPRCFLERSDGVMAITVSSIPEVVNPHSSASEH